MTETTTVLNDAQPRGPAVLALADPRSYLALATVSSALLATGNSAAGWPGLLLCLVLCFGAVRKPWLGVVAILPLVFSLPPAPTKVGLREALFAAVLAFVTLNLVVESVRRAGWRATVGVARWPLVLLLSYAAVNYLAAGLNGVPPADWARGIAPFVFLLFAIPVALAVRAEASCRTWLAGSFAALAGLLALHIVGYYLLHHLWEPYWLYRSGGEWIRSATAPDPAIQASGPLLDRITLSIAAATDALLPLGLIGGTLLAIWSESKPLRIVGAALALVMEMAILFTYTRSMLMSAVVVVAGLVAYVRWQRAELFRRSLRQVAILVVGAVAVIGLFGLGPIWLGRMFSLIVSLYEIIAARVPVVSNYFSPAAVRPELVPLSSNAAPADLALDANVTTRIEEYRIAWDMFLSHPLLGNGLGAKHAIDFVGAKGEILHQSVAYVHNWPLYALMAGGVVGLAVYAFILFGPIWRVRNDASLRLVVVCAVATMAIYGLFFCVFRLLTFNLILGVFWGLTMVRQATGRTD